MDREPKDYDNQDLYDRLARKRFQTGLVLALENLVSAGWRLVLWVMLFAALWLLRLPALGGPSAEWFFLVTFLLGTGWFTWKDLRSFRWPSRHDIDLRLENNSQLKHRPLTTLDDKLANPQMQSSRDLWGRSKERALASIAKLRIPFPRPILSYRDPYAFRVLVVLLVVIGGIIAGPTWKQRIHLGINPFYGRETEKVDKSITIWITPPTYTGQAQTILQGRGTRKDVLNIPEESQIKIQMTRGFGDPYVVMGEKKLPMKKVDHHNWAFEGPIIPADSLKIKQMGLTRASVNYAYITDASPAITLVEAPQTIDKGQTQIVLKVKDDYSVNDIALKIRLKDDYTDIPMGVNFEDIRAVLSPPQTEIELKPVYDLAWHPWAGLPVVIDITAIDHKKQTASIPSLHMTLPEREFKHPVAQKLISLRKRLIRTPEAASENVAHELFDIMAAPESYGGHPVVFLSLRSMASRLFYDPRLENIPGIIAQLWDTALQVEEGNLAMAARDLRNAQRKLEAALNNPDATQEEISEALDEFREALSQYFQEMMNQMQQQLSNGEMMLLPQEMFAGMVNPEDLQNFIDELTAQALAGNKDAAREMLSQMQQMMDSMNSASGEMQMPKDMQFMMKGISELQKLIEKQEQLLDQTRQQAEPFEGLAREQDYGNTLPFDMNIIKDLWGENYIPPPTASPNMNDNTPTPAVDTSANKEEQEALRYILGQLMQEAGTEMGQVPENMGEAELQMRGAAEKLGGNRPDMAIPYQEEALRQLKQSMDQMSQKMAQQLKRMMAMAIGPGMGRVDPLGRPMQDGEDGSSWLPSQKVKIPDEAERKRVREILDSLRKRSGEFSRPEYELEYYRRLMQQF
ncbi:MAG: DUF4175 domain-containing protein [Micavibrio sp.]